MNMTPEQMHEYMLTGTKPAQAEPAKALKTYEVTVTAKYPAAYERPGILEVQALNAADAIKKARKQMWNNGYDRHDGPQTYRAKAVK
jgi:hypothetical protein